MQFAGMNYLAILVAAIVALVIGAVYYGIAEQAMDEGRKA
jgi:hypothetical protein